MRQSRSRGVFLLFCYGAIAAAVTLLWTHFARTERDDSLFNSIVAIAEGRAPTPFVTRRMAVDAGRLLAGAVPDAVWLRVTEIIQNNSGLKREMRILGWSPNHYPLLISTTVIIGLSVLGFMYVIRAMIDNLYECPSWLADGLGGMMGIALLGGCGDHYLWYPYDLPNAFLFASTLHGIFSRRWWTLIAFAATSYSKETAVLLIAAYTVVNWRRYRTIRFWLVLSAMAITFCTVRLYVQRTFVTELSPQREFWYFGRNLEHLIYWLFFESWSLPFVVVAALRFPRVWRQFPGKLRAVSGIFLLLFGLALFKAWIEERRQYLEMIPVWGVMTVQWLLIELGLGRLLVSRDAQEMEALPVSHVGEEDALRPLLEDTKC